VLDLDEDLAGLGYATADEFDLTFAIQSSQFRGYRRKMILKRRRKVAKEKQAADHRAAQARYAARHPDRIKAATERRKAAWWARLKADPVRHAAYKDRQRAWCKARRLNR
jgi:hypothetical protein